MTTFNLIILTGLGFSLSVFALFVVWVWLQNKDGDEGTLSENYTPGVHDNDKYTEG